LHPIRGTNSGGRMVRRGCRNCAGTASASVVSLPERGSCPTNLPKMPARDSGLRMLPGGYRKPPPRTSGRFR
jgi:hypothetical protein